jgi:hypothetical protein
MNQELTWEQIKALATQERLSREALEKQVAQSGDAELAFRLARACVRDGKLTEALGQYDHAELLGHLDAHAERRIVARHVDDLPDQGATSKL